MGGEGRSTKKRAQCQGVVKKWRGGSSPLRALWKSEARDCDRKVQEMNVGCLTLRPSVRGTVNRTVVVEGQLDRLRG